jgi:streptomycin 6-kinase
VQGLDGERAAVWTLARVLQNALWDMGRLAQARLNPAHRWIAQTLLSRYRQ